MNIKKIINYFNPCKHKKHLHIPLGSFKLSYIYCCNCDKVFMGEYTEYGDPAFVLERNIYEMWNLIEEYKSRPYFY
jgi:hypothetical protein